MDALVTLDDSELDGEIKTAALGKTLVKHGDVLVRPAPKKGLELLINGVVTADVGDAVGVLAESPLKSRVNGLSGWQLSGGSQINFDLTIPLSAGAVGGSYIVDTNLSQARIALPKTDISFEQMQGVLHYRDGKGLFSNDLKGFFWGEPVAANLATKQDDLVVNMTGHLSMPSLGKFLNLPSGQILQGKTDVKANLWVPLEDVTLPLKLKIHSQLKGVVFNLPAPFGKEADSKRDVTADIVFADSRDIKVAMDDSLRVHLIQKEGVLVRGLLARDSEQTTLPEVGQLMAVGHLENFVLSEWQVVYSQLFRDTVDPGKTLSPVFDLYIEKLDVAGLSFEKAAVKGSHKDEGWQIVIDSDLAVGQVFLPKDTTLPIVLDLDRLSVPTPTEAGGDADSLDPASLPHVQLSVKNLSVGDRLFGEASFLMKPQSNGVMISGIDANLLGLQVGDKEYETTLEWTYEDGSHHTLVDGLFRAGNLGDVMEAWGLPEILDSDEANFFAEMIWPGKPWEISTTTMKGAMSLHLEKGRFYQSPKGATKQMIRLISLFNFDNWLRRLRLDFSDLFQEGMGYDEMQGGLVFDQGTMTFDAPIVVKLTSGRVKLSGTANLLSEDIDAHLVTTLPLGTNLPWVVALIGGLPAAAGVYVTGKVFKKQVDRLSSISYRITGPWSEPEVVVERIFSDKIFSNKRSNDKSGTRNNQSNNYHIRRFGRESKVSQVAALQMTSGGSLEANLQQAQSLIEQAVKQGAKLLVLPEYFAYHGCGDISATAQQEQYSTGPARTFLAEQASYHQVWIVGGTIPVAIPDDERAMASCFVVNDEGREVACYQKIHLFDALVDDAKGRYRESDNYCHGDQPVVVETPFGKLGLTVCYDLRFPELYRYLADQGAEIMVVPSAFTATTGEAHWQLLLRARAVENLCYVIGANMGDRTHPKQPTWGGSAVVDPWGNILSELDDGQGVVTAGIDLDYLKKLRQKMPVHEHRRFSVVKPSH